MIQYLLSCTIIIILVLYLYTTSNKLEKFESYNKQTIPIKSNNKKIAFCFLIYDKINNEKLWHNFFKNIDKNKYNIYIHYKENKPLNYFESYKIKNTVPTKWCGISLVKAQNKLLEYGVKDKNNTHFIFVSNSCIPLKSFNYIYNTLDTNYSYFNKAIQYFKEFSPSIKAYKASQWCILNRKHTQKILENYEILNTIFKIFKTKYVKVCPDEYIYISLFYHLGLENELILTTQLSSDTTTFTGWTDMTNYKDFSKSIKKGQPNNYSFICKEELDYLVKSKSLFGRKFIDGCVGLEHLHP